MHPWDKRHHAVFAGANSGLTLDTGSGVVLLIAHSQKPILKRSCAQG